jgi:uncharacterized protein (DUF169 family)
MKAGFKEGFLGLWNKHFDGAELPVAFYYTDAAAVPGPAEKAGRCLIASLEKVRRGVPIRFGLADIACPGGRRYTGFADGLRPNFEYFLSCGLPGKMEGERYKKSPELVREIMARGPRLAAPGRYLVFKRWDILDAAEEPDVVVFFATPDVLAGLFTLASFDTAEESGVFAPFSAGCGSIVLYPYLEKDRPEPRAVLGMFDPSARPHVPAATLTFAVPMARFARMVANMEESFLVTPTWDVIRKRIAAAAAVEIEKRGVAG